MVRTGLAVPTRLDRLANWQFTRPDQIDLVSYIEARDEEEGVTILKFLRY